MGYQKNRFFVALKQTFPFPDWTFRKKVFSAGVVVVSLVLLWYFCGPKTFWEQIIVTSVGLGAWILGLVVFFLCSFVFSAPASIDEDHRKAIRIRDRRIREFEKAPKLEIFYDENLHMHWKVPSRQVFFRVGLRHNGNQSVPRVEAKIESLEFLGRREAVKNKCRDFVGLPLMLVQDTLEAPRKAFPVEPGPGVELDVIRMSIGQSSSDSRFWIQHARTTQTLHGKYQRDPSPVVPAGRYRLTLVVHGQDIAPVRQKIIVNLLEKKGPIFRFEDV